MECLTIIKRKTKLVGKQRFVVENIDQMQFSLTREVRSITITVLLCVCVGGVVRTPLQVNAYIGPIDVNPKTSSATWQLCEATTTQNMASVA